MLLFVDKSHPEEMSCLMCMLEEMCVSSHYINVNCWSLFLFKNLLYFNTDLMLIQILMFMLMCLLIATPVANLLEPDIITMGYNGSKKSTV